MLAGTRRSSIDWQVVEGAETASPDEAKTTSSPAGGFLSPNISHVFLQ
jgi:hypothetical protein